jgi:hypothetical protein
LEADTAIREAIFSNGYYLCLQDNLKIVVFDTAYKRVKSLEDSLNIFPISSIYSKGDTTFIMQSEPDLLGYPKYEYYFTRNFKIQKRKYLIEESNFPINGWPLFEDSTYDIFSNHIGSGGFLVFFRNRLTKKTYSTWSWSPRQIFKFANTLYIAEDGDYKISPGFRKIPDPTKLIEVTDDEAQKLCMLYQHLSISPGKYYEKLGDSIEHSMLSVYGGFEKKYNIPIYTFIKNNSLFTILKNDSSINLVIHKNDSLVGIQTILDTSFGIDRLSYYTANKNHFITFEESGGKTIDGQMQSFSNYGFILIKDSAIDIRQYYIHKPYPR